MELITEEQIKKRDYAEYRDFVKRVMFRDKYICKVCGIKSKNIEVHHLDGYNWCAEKRTDDTNGITLCHDCHMKFHSFYGKGDNTKEQFEEWIGKPIELLESSYVKPKEKQIFCIEDNKVYGIYEFAKIKNLRRNLVYAVCNKNNNAKSIQGYHIVYLDDYEKMTNEEIENLLAIANAKKVICVETNEIFNSINEASIKYNTSSSNIGDCCNGNQKTTCGLHWMFIEDYNKLSQSEIKQLKLKYENEKPKKIICVETQEKFNCATDIYKKYGYMSYNIIKCCDKERIKCNGYHWLYLDEYQNLKDKEHIEYKKPKEKGTHIICIETNEVYSSINEASKKINGDASTIARCCKGESLSYRNQHWMYLSDYNNLSEEEKENILLRFVNPNYKKVVCLDTREIFDSVEEAKRKYNVNNICQCCKGKILSTKGFHWRYLEDYQKMTEEEIKEVCSKIADCRRKIVCLDTGEQFNSITEASEKYNVEHSLIDACCLKITKSTKGFHWAYLEDYEKMSEEEIKNICNFSIYRKVICLETKEKFDSIAEGCRKYNADRIWECCNNQKETSGGYHWKYLEDYEKMSKEEIDKLTS